MCGVYEQAVLYCSSVHKCTDDPPLPPDQLPSRTTSNYQLSLSLSLSLSLCLSCHSHTTLQYYHTHHTTSVAATTNY